MTTDIHRALCLVLSLASCRDAPATTPAVRTDAAGLRTLVALPSQTDEVRWVLDERVPGGCSWVPGPSDTTIVARVALDNAAWTDFQAKTGASGAKGEVRVGEALAELLFDPAQLARLPKDGDARVIEGSQVDLGRVMKGPYDGRAVRWGDMLILRLGTRP